MKEAYIYDAIRTPRGKGKKEGLLHEVKPIDLLVTLLKAMEDRCQLDTELVEDVIIGCVNPIDEQGGNIAKTAVQYAQWSDRVAGMQLNRFSASALEAINLAAIKIRSGWSELIVAGGIESMSRLKMGADGSPMIFDPTVSVAINFVPQGIAADLLATKEGYTREALDAYALQSQQNALNAQEQGYFAASIIPVRDKVGLSILEKDEAIRSDTSAEKLTALSPAFAAIGQSGYNYIALQKYPMIERLEHLHTAGNSAEIVDGAALVLIGNRAMGEKIGIKPRAKIIAAAVVSAEPTIMLEGATPAAQKALKQANLTPEDIDLWEVNEAFAAAVLKFKNDFNLSEENLNVNGGAIALGDPLGATGAILIGTILDELERRNLKRGLVTTCVGGGMGVATIIERV